MVFVGRCNNVQAADIVFLVDGSSSIGQANFLQVKGFMAGIIKPFASSVNATGIRFGAIQYSDTSRWLAGLILSSTCPALAAALHIHGLFLFFRVEFTFSSYLNGTQLVNAVQNLNYKGGNTRTGAGLKYVADNLFNSASRRDVPKVCRVTISSTRIFFLKKALSVINLWLFNFQICILITDGRSQDNVQEPAQKLRSQGVYIFAVGTTFLSIFLLLWFCCYCCCSFFL